MLDLVAGYVGHRTVQIGLQHGIFDQIPAHVDGITLTELTAKTGLDPFYLEVWCRAAYAAGVIDRVDDGYRLDSSIATLLTDRDSPAHIGGLFLLLDQPEMFDDFARRLPTGEQTWWDQVGPDFIRGVAETSRPAYLRLVPGGFAQVPGLDEVLAGEADVLEMACGAGFGLARLAHTYPFARLVGVDGDQYSLELAGISLAEAGADVRVELVHSTLESFEREGAFDVAVINLSMHECRDIDRVTRNVRKALRPGGCFVISDFPFPANPESLQTSPGRIMTGIQFFEAQIGDQLLPTQSYLELLARHGFTAIDSFDITPTHAVVHGRKPEQ